MNLRDITTQNDLKDKKAVFAFDIHPRISPILALGYSVQIRWSQLRIEFGSHHGIYTLYLPPEGVRSCGGAQNATLELIKASSYKLIVPTVVFGSGPLSINVSVSLACLQLTSHYCPLCSQWRYTSQASSNIDISAKRGRATTEACSASCVTDSTAILYTTYSWLSYCHCITFLQQLI